jgi:methanogenic corrinoid protein MtbC1
MEGSRPPDGAGYARGASSGTSQPDEVCLDRRYVEHGRVVPKSEQKLDRQLEHVIEGEIIPRLMMLHRRDQPKFGGSRAKPVNLADHVEEFAGFIVRHEVHVVAAYVKALMQKGADLESLLVHLFAPTARRLGELWENDTIDFVDVTIGTARLQQILHHFTFPLEKSGADPRRRVLLSPTPGEQHTFGLFMVSKFFRREGWQVWSGMTLSAQEVQGLVAEESFAVIGFSLSSDRLIDSLRSTIHSVRRVSRNRSARIMVGGRIFAADAELAANVGADLVIAEARDAPMLAESVMPGEAGRRH